MKIKAHAVISAYTGYLSGDFDDMHEYIEYRVGRPVFTHELPDIPKDTFKPDFLKVVEAIRDIEVDL